MSTRSDLHSDSSAATKLPNHRRLTYYASKHTSHPPCSSTRHFLLARCFFHVFQLTFTFITAFNMSRRNLRQVLKYSSATFAAGAAAGLGGWAIWARKSRFETFTPATDPLFDLPLLKTANPNKNPSVDVSCLRVVPITGVKQDLVQDHQNGGSKLVTAFCQGMWGGYGR